MQRRICICEEASFYATIRFRTSCGVETELTEAFTQFDELGVTEWKQQH